MCIRDSHWHLPVRVLDLHGTAGLRHGTGKLPAQMLLLCEQKEPAHFAQLIRTGGRDLFLDYAQRQLLSLIHI